MPFTKTKKTKKVTKEISLAEYLGISKKRADEIAAFVRERVMNTEVMNKGEFLMELNDKYNDNELLFAAFAFGAAEYAFTHRPDPMAMLLKSLLEDK